MNGLARFSARSLSPRLDGLGRNIMGRDRSAVGLKTVYVPLYGLVAARVTRRCWRRCSIQENRSETSLGTCPAVLCPRRRPTGRRRRADVPVTVALSLLLILLTVGLGIYG